ELRSRLLDGRRQELEREAIGLIRAAVAQLRAVVTAELEATIHPNDPATLDRLREAERRAEELAAVASTWQRTLSYRMEALHTACEADLGARLLAVRHEARDRVEEG